MGKERDSLFDNLKGVLIFLVVFGHMIEEFVDKSRILFVVYAIVYSVHMALFIYISGYFSKDAEKSRKKAFYDFLLPYLLLNTVYQVFTSLWFRKVSITYLTPGWVLWYMLSVWFLKVLLPDILKMRWNLLLLVLLALAAGAHSEISYLLSLSRTICYAPFFLLGYLTKRETIDRIRSYRRFIIPAGVSLVAAQALFWNGIHDSVRNMSYFIVQTMGTSYKLTGLSIQEGMLLRAASMVVSVLMGIFLIALVPGKRLPLVNRWGVNSMLVFIGHPYLLLVYFRYMPDWYGGTGAKLAILLSPVAMTLFLGWEPLSRIYRTTLDLIVRTLTGGRAYEAPARADPGA